MKAEHELDQLRRAERVVLAIRWGVMAAWLPILQSGPYAGHASVWVVHAGVALYTVVTHVAVVRGAFIERVARATVLGDAASVFAMCAVSGGLASDIYPYFYFHVLTTAIRFERRETFVALSLDAMFSLALFVIAPTVGVEAVALRQLLLGVFYLSVIATVAALLSREAKEQYARAVDESRRRHDLLWRLLHAEDEERKRIAGEIHDRMGQRFVRFRHLLDAWRARVAPADPDTVEQVLELETEVAAMADETRQIVYDLRPPVLDDFGFVETLREYVAVDGSAGGAKVTLSVDEGRFEIRPKAAVALFRILQEAVRNVQKHARAKTVAIELRRGVGGAADLTVRDDGVGFDSTKPVPGHLGLLTMRERVEALGGTLEIDTAPGRGTVVRATVPACEEQLR